jgi:molecular chaperone GrpE (heat shock protein)
MEKEVQELLEEISRLKNLLDRALALVEKYHNQLQEEKK